MFDNVIGQKEVVRSLGEELSRSMLPRALLFHGPVYSGKLTVALEVARILTCRRGEGDWGCRCHACRQQRLLIHPGILLMGPRYFREEIIAAGDVLMRNPRVQTRTLYVRAVRKLLKRFDRILWEDEESRSRGAISLVAETEEELERLAPAQEPPAREELEKLVESISNRCERIISDVQQDNIPIHHVRKTTYWAHLSSFSDKKIVIMENVDRMQESSRNALLSILEGPPEDVYFILTATRKSLVIQTLQSRLRPYAFSDRPASEQREVLRRIFQEESEDFESLREYFLAWKDLNPHSLKGLARTFLEMVEKRKDHRWMPMDDMAELMVRSARQRRTTSEETLSVFCEELILNLRDRLRKGGRSVPELCKLQGWTDMIQSNLLAMGNLNLPPQLVLENLYFRMRETA